MTRLLLVSTLGLVLTATTPSLCHAQQTPPVAEDPAHDELRALRDKFLAAFEQKDIGQMLTYLTENVVITVQNAEVLRGHDQVREFHERMSDGDKREVRSLTTKLEVDELSILYGENTAIALGSMNDHFQLKSGMEFDLHSRWTAALVKQEGVWKLAAFHVSTNMFDNGVSNMMTRWAAIKTGGTTLAVGLVGGVLAAILWKRRKT